MTEELSSRPLDAVTAASDGQLTNYFELNFNYISTKKDLFKVTNYF